MIFQTCLGFDDIQIELQPYSNSININLCKTNLSVYTENIGVTLSYNQAKLLSESLASVIHQTKWILTKDMAAGTAVIEFKEARE